MTYPPTGDPNQNPYFGGQPAPPGPPTGAFPPQAAPGYPPPQYAPPPQYPATPPGGYQPQQAPPTQGWQAPPPTQGWQQPPPMGQGWQMPPKKPTNWVPLAVIAGVVVLALVGGGLVIAKLVGKDDPTTPDVGSLPGVTAGAPTTAGKAPTLGSTKSSSAAAGPAKYKAPGDLCSTDLSALGPWSAKKEKTTPNVRNTGGIARSDCDFDLRTAAGQKVTYGIRTQVYTTAKEARQYFDTGYGMDKSRYFDADLTGIGEQSYGTNRDWDIGSKTSDYTIRVVDSNLYVTVSLVTFGNAFVPKDQLKPQAIAEIKAIIAKLPTA